MIREMKQLGHYFGHSTARLPGIKCRQHAGGLHDRDGMWAQTGTPDVLVYQSWMSDLDQMGLNITLLSAQQARNILKVG